MTRSNVRMKGNVVWIKHPTKKKYFWDVSAFIPNMKGELRADTTYISNVSYEIQNLPSGKEIRIPKCIKINGKSYTNMR